MPLDVSCAIIEHKGQVLAVQRSESMRQPLLWEFPGGKLEAGESARDSIIREIREELNIEIRPLQQLPNQLYTYDWGTVCLIPFVCEWITGQLRLQEHKAARWLAPHELELLNWAPADLPVIKAYLMNEAK